MLSMQEMQSTTGGGVISLEDQELSRSVCSEGEISFGDMGGSLGGETE